MTATTSSRALGVVVAHGRLAWPVTAALLSSANCAWQDIDGWNVAGCPPKPPDGITHLWAWATDRLFVARIRPDGDAIVAELVTGDTSDTAGEPVGYERRPALGWAPDDQSVGADVTGFHGEQYVVEGSTPLTFVRLRDEAD